MEREAIDIRQLPDIIEWVQEQITGKSRFEREMLLAQAAQIWPVVECRLLELGDDKVSARQLFLVIEECLVAEVRAQRLDLHARATFSKPKQRIQETRGALEAVWRERAQQSPEVKAGIMADRLRTGALEHGLVELG